MDKEKEIRSWIFERRRELWEKALADASRGRQESAISSQVSAEFACLTALEAHLDQVDNEGRPNWHWGILVVLIASILLIVFSLPHFSAGRIALTAQTTAVRLQPHGVIRLGPGSLPLDGFRVFEVRGVAGVTDSLFRSPVKFQDTQGVFRFGDKSRISAINCNDSELVVERTARDEVTISVFGAKSSVEVTPNGTPMWVPQSGLRCPDDPGVECLVPERSVLLSTDNALEIRLRRQPMLMPPFGEASVIRSGASLSRVTFDTKVDRQGLETGRRSHLIEAVLHMRSFGDEVINRFWGQSLAIDSINGAIEIVSTASALGIRLSGEGKAIRGLDDENLTPSTLKWLWQNKVVALYFAAGMAFIGFFVERVPAILRWIRK